MEQASSLSHELKLVPPIKLFPFSPISAKEAEGARPGGHMKIDSSIPPIDPNASSLKDSIQIQAENRQVVQAVRAVNASGKLGVSDLTFSLDRYTRRPVVKLVNRQTNEVVAQIPNERVLRIAEELKTS